MKINEETLVCLFLIRDWKSIDWIHWNMFCFQFHILLEMIRVVSLYLQEFFCFDEPSSQFQTPNKNKEMKIIQFWIFIFIWTKRNRAIRTRTVDFLSKTDQTDYYQNDPNCFKDPTCIFLHWALSLTDINISQSAIFFLDRKRRRWLLVLWFIIFILIQEHYQSVSEKGYLDVGLPLA